MPTDADAEAVRQELAELRSRVTALNDAAVFLLLDTLVRRKALCADDIDAAVRSIRATIPDYLRGPDLDRFVAAIEQRYRCRPDASKTSCAWKPTLITGGRPREPADASS